MKMIARFVLLMTFVFIGIIATTQGAKAVTDPRVITTAGTYTQEQADANVAAFEQYENSLNQIDEAHREFVASCIAQLTQRDQTYADDMNARWAIMEEQKERIFALEAKVAHKNQVIRELRAKIRALEGR